MGPIHATIPPFMWGDNNVARDAWREMGVRVAVECPDGDKEGICSAPNSQHALKGRRSYAGLGHYLDVVYSRKNYDLLAKHQVTRLLFPPGNGSTVVESRRVNGGPVFNISATAEVILAAGAFNTPAILLQSGIGAAKGLQGFGVPELVSLPGVGANLQDHSGPVLAWSCKSNQS